MVATKEKKPDDLIDLLFQADEELAHEFSAVAEPDEFAEKELRRARYRAIIAAWLA